MPPPVSTHPAPKRKSTPNPAAPPQQAPAPQVPSRLRHRKLRHRRLRHRKLRHRKLRHRRLPHSKLRHRKLRHRRLRHRRLPARRPEQAAAPALTEIDPVPELLTRLVQREVELHALRAELAKLTAELEQARQLTAVRAQPEA